MRTEHGMILRILLLLICISIGIPIQTAAAQDGQPLFFSESYRNNENNPEYYLSKEDKVSISKDAEDLIICSDNTSCPSNLLIETRHEWQDMIDADTNNFVQPVFTLSLKKDGAPVTGQTQTEWFYQGESIGKISLSFDENGTAEFAIPLGWNVQILLPDGTDYTVSADYLTADVLINNQNAAYSGSTNGQKQTVSVNYAVTSWLEFNASYDGRGIYNLARYPGETIFLDNIDITDDTMGYYPTLIIDKDGNKRLSRNWFNPENIYQDDHLSVSLTWDDNIIVPLPVGTQYHFTDNFLYCDLVMNGMAKRDADSVIQSGRNYYDMDYTLKLITIRYKKYVVGPYNGKAFRLRLDLGIGSYGDEWIQAPTCTLNGKPCGVTPITDYYMHQWEILETVHGGEEIIVENVPYGAYYFFEEPDWAVEEDYLLITGWPDRPDGSSGYAAWTRVVDGVMELAFTNHRFNYGLLFISKALPDDPSELPESELNREFKYTITMWDEKLSNGKKVPITGEFPYVIQTQDEDGNWVEKSTGTLTLNSKGVGTFTLKYGDMMVINKLYSSSYYSITEANLNDYMELSAFREWENVRHEEGNVIHYSWEPAGDFDYTETRTQSGKIFRVDRTEVGFKNVYMPEYDKPEPPKNDPPNPEDFPGSPDSSVLPGTGFSSVKPVMLTEQPHDLRYAATGLTLEIPELELNTDLVTVPKENGSWSVSWLGSKAGLLEGSAEPGAGRALIAAHNHLNTTEAGPFVNLYSLSEGDRVFIRDAKNGLRVFTIYANEKIAETDFAALDRISGMHENSLTLITCEDERASGGYASRRIIAAMPVE